MAFTDTKLRRLQPKERAYQLADGGGLYVEVQPTGKTVWRMQYRLGGRGSKKERVTLGEYPAHTLSQARLWREQCRALIAHGQSPAAAKQAERVAQVGRATDSVAAFANLWYADVVTRTNSEARNIRRVLDEDVLPAIGDKPVADVSIPDILAITDAVKARGADQMALQTRNVIKRLFAYAIARGKKRFNPAAAIEARFIATARSRDVALSQAEIGQLLRGIYQSSIRRQYKLALHLLVLCMIRNGELIGARWGEIDFEKAEWLIPAARPTPPYRLTDDVVGTPGGSSTALFVMNPGPIVSSRICSRLFSRYQVFPAGTVSCWKPSKTPLRAVTKSIATGGASRARLTARSVNSPYRFV